MTDPLTDAIVGGIFGGILTSPFFVYLGYRLNERANRIRILAERAQKQAKAALLVILVLWAVKGAAESLPREPREVTTPESQLTFTTAAFLQIMSLKDIIATVADLPPDLREDALSPLGVANELTDCVKAVRERAAAITRIEPSEESPEWMSDQRKWAVNDSDDSEFARLFRSLAETRKHLLEAVDQVLPRLSALTKVLDAEG